MKNILVILFSFLIFSSCKKDSNTTLNKDLVYNKLISGAWQIASFWDKDKEAAKDYQIYQFAFHPNKTLYAGIDINSPTVNGSWSVVENNGKVYIIITYTSPSLFTRLTKDWEVVEMSEIRIKTKKTSNGEIYNLVIDKI